MNIERTLHTHGPRPYRERGQQKGETVRGGELRKLDDSHAGPREQIHRQADENTDFVWAWARDLNGDLDRAVPSPEPGTSAGRQCNVPTLHCAQRVLTSTQSTNTHTHTGHADRQTEWVWVRERGRVWGSETAFHQRWQTHRLLMASVVVKRLGRQLPDIDIWDASLCLALTRFFTRSPPHHPFLFLPSLPFSMTLFHFECPVHANLLPHTPLMPILSFL